MSGSSDTLLLQTDGAVATLLVGEALGGLAQPGDVLLLSGDLGAGKTQFVKGLALGLGVPEPVTSPTFNILLVHEGRLTLNHLDLYRLERAEQLEDIDYFGTLESDGVTAVEWGDRFAEAAPDDCLAITLRILSDSVREIEVLARGTAASARVRALADTLAGAPGVRLLAPEERA